MSIDLSLTCFETLLISSHFIFGRLINGKIYLYTSATIAAYAALAALSSQTGPAYSLGRSPSPQSWTLACSHTAARSPGLSFNGLNLRNPCKYGLLRELAQTDDSSTILIIIMIYDLLGGEGRNHGFHVNFVL